MLALAAARLGHAPVLACDDDPLAVEVARENAARNGCDIQVWQCDALYDELPKGVGLWLANLQLAPLQELAWRPDLPPRLIVSGLLADEAFEIRRATASRSGARWTAGRGCCSSARRPQ